MKKAFKFFAIALLAGTVMISCNKDEEENGGNNETPGDPILLETNFDNGMPDTYTILDNDGDGDTWECKGLNMGVDESDCATSCSYINNFGPLEPDNYMITPAITIPNGKYSISWQVRAQDPNYPGEVYDVYVGTLENGTFTSLGTLHHETIESDAWKTRTIDLSAYAGKTVSFAFRHHDVTDMYWMHIDNIKVFDNTL